MPSTTLSKPTPFLHTTSMKWTPDGELSAEDRLRLLHRLMQIDPCLLEGKRH
ncbi:MAG: hypothetical protein VKP70_09565 [Cyanobacteriota bacterium]|nr:hypothetical protein [Cyanobacteriota bacterium]